MLKGGLMKMRLRNWVKVVLNVIALIILLMLTWFCIKGISDIWQRDLDSCIAGGHSEYWCRKNL